MSRFWKVLVAPNQFVVERKGTKRVRVKDLIQIPPHPKNDNRKRKVTRKVPSWHLTSQESMEFIAESSKKTEEKQKAADEETKVKHEAVLKHRRLKRNMTKKRVLLLPLKLARQPMPKVSHSATRSKRDNLKRK